MTSPPSPSGCISRLEEMVRLLLADCESVRTFLHVESQSEALERIHASELPEQPCEEDGGYSLGQMRELRPLVLVYANDGTMRWTKRASNPSSTVKEFSGDVIVELERDVPAEYCNRPDWAYRAMANVSGDVAGEAIRLSGVSPYPSIDAVQALETCIFTHPQEMHRLGYAQTCRLGFTVEQS